MDTCKFPKKRTFLRAAWPGMMVVLIVTSVLKISAQAALIQSVPSAELADQSTYSEDVQSGGFATRTQAIADFRKLCQAAEARLLRPVIQPLVVSSVCENAVENGGTSANSFAYKGQLNVVFSKPLSFEVEQIESGLFESESEASAEWTIRCQGWLTKYKNSQRRVLVEECGQPKSEKLGVTSSGQALWLASSKGLRVFDLKTAYQVHHSCYCRQSATYRDYVNTRTGKPGRVFFEKYDLMYLDYSGYYRIFGAFDLHTECEDAASQTKICQEQ